MQIFCIHGWGGSAKSLEPLALTLQSKLGSGSTVSVIELPGFASTPLTRVFSFSDYVQYVQEQIASNLQVDQELVIVGHSFGGKIIMQLGIDSAFPEARFVLVNASGIFPNNSLKKRIFKVVTVLLSPVKLLLGVVGMDKLARGAFYKYIVRARDYERITTPELRETFKQVIKFHIDEEKLKQVPNPTLLLWSGKDNDTPLWMGDKIAAALPNVELKVFPDATHGLPLKQPDAVAAEIIRWISI